MQLTNTDIQEFQKIILDDYGVALALEEASENAHKLIQLMEIVLELDDQKGGDANVKNT